jgi:acetyl esterase/lipase
VEGVAPAIISAGRGQIAVAPDYLGLPAFGTPDPAPHPWIIGEPSGIVALDALRAVADWLPTSGEKARIDQHKIVYWGWSEGGYTALMADRWAPHYAPDFAPRGVIAAIPPVDLVGQVREGLETFAPATGAAAVMLTLAAEWYGVGGLDTVLQPDVLTDLPGELAEECADFPSVVSATATTDLFLPTFIDAMTTETGVKPWTCLLERSSVASETVPYASDAPVLLITGEGDRLVPEGPVRAAIPTLCDQGYAIEHRSCDGLDHSDAATRTLREQIRWLDARMDGTPAGSACGATAPVTCGG